MKRKLVKLRGPLARLLLALQLFALPAQFALRAWAMVVQARPGVVSADDARRARAAAAAFAERLLRSRDLGAVVREMYVSDFARRYVEQQSGRAVQGPPRDFMFEGIPSLRFSPALLARPESELWPRLYVAANNLHHYGFLSFMARGGPSPGRLEQEVRDVYPRGVAELFDKNPSLANFLVRKGDYVPVGTTEELRDVVTRLEEAARLTRAALDSRLPLKEEKLERSLGELRRVTESMEVRELQTGGRAFMGYPAGARFFRVLTPVGLDLLLVREGEAMKVVWAHMMRN